MRYGIAIVFLLASSRKALSEYDEEIGPGGVLPLRPSPGSITSYPQLTVDICLISSISLICLKELSKKSIEICGPRFLSMLEKKQV